MVLWYRHGKEIFQRKCPQLKVCTTRFLGLYSHTVLTSEKTPASSCLMRAAKRLASYRPWFCLSNNLPVAPYTYHNSLLTIRCIKQQASNPCWTSHSERGRVSRHGAPTDVMRHEADEGSRHAMRGQDRPSYESPLLPLLLSRQCPTSVPRKSCTQHKITPCYGLLLSLCIAFLSSPLV